MRRSLQTLIFVFLFVFVKTSARADWQYTKWAMTAEQAITAAGGKLRPTTASERQHHSRYGQEPGLTGDYVGGDFSFSVDLFFGPAGLRMVSLDLKDGSQTQLLANSLQARYGSPQEDKSQGSVVVWRSIRPSERNTVQLTAASFGTFIIYGPLAGDGSGL